MKIITGGLLLGSVAKLAAFGTANAAGFPLRKVVQVDAMPGCDWTGLGLFNLLELTIARRYEKP